MKNVIGYKYKVIYLCCKFVTFEIMHGLYDFHTPESILFNKIPKDSWLGFLPAQIHTPKF